jgi:glycosyltransferase involved in cell wall biosynthesis
METLMGELCTRMASRGHDVTVVTRSLPQTSQEEFRSGVRIFRVRSPGGRFSFPLAALPLALRIARSCDVVHTTTFSAAPLGSFISRIARRPVVLTVPELWIGKWHDYSDAPLLRAALFDIIERAIFAFPYDAYVGISNYTTKRLHTHLGSRGPLPRTIYCGFDPAPWTVPVDVDSIRAERNVAPEDFLIVAYGRPGISKGFRYLIDAFPQLAVAIPNVRLRLILSDSKATARDLAALKRRADPRIDFERPLPLSELSGVIRSADCVVVPSLAEGFGYAVLEAANADVPLVVSNTTSIPEVVGGRYQFSAPRDVDSLVRGITRVSQRDFLTREVPRFDWATAVNEYERVYESLVGGASSTARNKR